MKYQQPTFTLPAGSNKVTQEEWDRIFSNTCPTCKSKGFHPDRVCIDCSTIPNIEIQKPQPTNIYVGRNDVSIQSSLMGGALKIDSDD